ncbi:hypothetical protein ACO2Q7_08880 [Rathayibacter sp. KR2-224]|uniref:hypothetical protein n=1 Tax=Rathayibacter sp. KR2-224 TaxID=3400913 RepID=UPI003C09CBEB
MTYQPQPQPTPSPVHEGRTRNTLGVVSFILGLAVVLVSLVQTFSLLIVVRTYNVAYSVISGIGMSVVGVLGVAALAVGIVALLKRGAPKGFAGAGVALGGQALLFLLVNLVETAVMRALL